MYKELHAQDIANRLKKGERFEILDVREPDEWMSGHIPFARHIPLAQIPDRRNEIDNNKEYVVVCRSGNRSARACEYLSAHGFRVINMAGGMSEWTGDIQVGK